jgi:Arc/MetJ-type ribon-helix-helix transcriptional regulator
VPANDRARLEHLCRYLLRSPLVQDRLRLRADGRGPAEVRAAVDGRAESPGNAALGRLIEAPYAARSALGEARFAALLARVRRTLRRSIGRGPPPWPSHAHGMMYPHTRRTRPMAKTKVAVTLDSETLRRVDRLVRDARYPSRSQAIEAAVAAQLERLEHRRLAEECGKLDPATERAMAEEGLGVDMAGWPEY